MLDYARQRAAEILKNTPSAVLATSGPAGVQASALPIEAAAGDVYLLVPRTSDHLFNLEHNPNVTLLADGWELNGAAQTISPDQPGVPSGLLQTPEAGWCALVRVAPQQIHILRVGGWGHLETIDLSAL